MKNKFLSIVEQFKRSLNRKMLGGRQRRMRLCETISLGEKRFVAVLRVDHQQFLIAGGGSTVTLLSRLPVQEMPEQEIEEIVQARALAVHDTAGKDAK